MSLIFNDNFLNIVKRHAALGQTSQPKPPMMKTKSADLIREVLLSHTEFETINIMGELEKITNNQLMCYFYGILRKDYAELRSLDSSSLTDNNSIVIAKDVIVNVQDACNAFCITVAYLENVRSLVSPAQKQLCRVYLERTASWLAGLLLNYYNSKPNLG